MRPSSRGLFAPLPEYPAQLNICDRHRNLSTKPSTEPDQRILEMLRLPVAAAQLFVVTIAALILGAWFNPSLATLAPQGWSKMVANTATALLLAALSSALSAERRSPLQARLSQAAGFAVLAIGALTLAEYALGISFGIDTWLPFAPSVTYPGRPSPQTALGLVLVGVSLVVARESKGGRSLFADLLVVLLVGFDVLMISGSVYGALRVTGLSASTLISPHTLSCFALLTFDIVGRRAKQGRMFADLVGIGIGSRIVRMVLPFAILLPFASFGLVGYLVGSGTTTIALARCLTAAMDSLLVLSSVVWMASRINVLERKVRDLSLIDELTQVNNRRGVYFLAQQEFLHAVRFNTGLTVMFFDLDDLKRANDTIGHHAGSAMIRALARILADNFRDSDIVGRVGGDEFVVVTTRDDGQARKALARVRARVDEYNKAAALAIPLCFSVGLAEFVHGSTESLDALVAYADSAMYHAKAAKNEHGGVRGRST